MPLEDADIQALATALKGLQPEAATVNATPKMSDKKITCTPGYVKTLQGAINIAVLVLF